MILKPLTTDLHKKATEHIPTKKKWFLKKKGKENNLTYSISVNYF